MCWQRCLRAGVVLFLLGTIGVTVGCTDNPREPGGGGTASGTTEKGGGAVTTASPGGGNVRPNEGTPAVR